MFCSIFEWLTSAGIITSLIGTFTFVVLVYYYWWKPPHPRYPPGVRGVPILGAIPLLSPFPHRVLLNWSKKYGAIFSARFGRSDAVVLNDYTSVYQAFVENYVTFQSRPDVQVVNEYTSGFGFAFSKGQCCLDVKKFSAQAIRSIGIVQIEKWVQEVAEGTVKQLGEFGGNAIDVKTCIGRKVADVMTMLLFGRFFGTKDQHYEQFLKDCFDNVTDPAIYSQVNALMFVPLLRHIPWFGNALSVHQNIHFRLKDFCRKEIEEHKKTLNVNEPRDYVDAFLIEMRNHSPRDSWFHEENLVNCLVDIYTAGTDAPTNVILWAIVTLLHKPNLQHLLFHEINNKTNSNEDLSNRWPLLKAFIQENFRFNPPAPLSIPHQTNQGVKLDKYFIPKDTMIISNIYAVNHDPKIWKNPYEFNIYRHIDTDGKFVPSTKVIAFGIGCRSCLGEKLGRLEIFYFLANMIKRFEILPDPGSKDLPPINEGGNSILHLPIHFKVVFKPRENEDYFSL